jgi:hypothetical protein
MTLVCDECDRTSEIGEVWKAELAVDLREDKAPHEVAVFCPECWSREFGDA